MRTSARCASSGENSRRILPNVVAESTALSYAASDGAQESVGRHTIWGGAFDADGSTQLFGSPGLPFVPPGWFLKPGLQLPIHQDITSPRPMADSVYVFWLRFQF